MTRLTKFGSAALVAAIAGLLAWSCALEAEEESKTSPTFGVSLPPNFRSWELIAPAREYAPFGELRVVLGNAIAVEAYRVGTLLFPDGDSRQLAWKKSGRRSSSLPPFPERPQPYRSWSRIRNATPRRADGDSDGLSEENR